MTLTDFLLARIAEDEAVAGDVQGELQRLIDRNVYLSGYVPNITDTGIYSSEDGSGDPAVLVAPARVLAECEAKRRIVTLHGPDEYWVDEVREEGQDIGRDAQCKLCGCGDCWPVDSPCATLKLLALPYADHANYREEWKP